MEMIDVLLHLKEIGMIKLYYVSIIIMSNEGIPAIIK